MKTSLLTVGLLALLLAACAPAKLPVDESTVSSSSAPAAMMERVPSKKTTTVKTDAEWKATLTADEYAVLRQGGTETPFTSPLVDEHRKGTFVTADCNIPVFRSEQKYDSGTGWPSFWAPISPSAVVLKQDTAFGMSRTEVQSTCGGHLGHVFDDGPAPTGKRYCMNGIALKFIPDENN